LVLQDAAAPSEAWDMTWQRHQLPEDNPAALKRSPHRLQWWIVVLVLVLASACSRAHEAAPPASGSPSTTESSSDSIAPSQRANLQMRQVMEIVPPSSAAWDETKVTCSAHGQALSDCVASAQDVGGIVLLGPEQGDGKYVLGPVIVDETGVVHATAQREGPYAPSYSAYWSVYIDLSADGAEAFELATEVAAGSGYPQDQIAIIVDGRIVSSPTVMAPIPNGSVVLTGSFTESQARLLASNLSGSG
jgi:preprotein translocase subunit SecD